MSVNDKRAKALASKSLIVLLAVLSWWAIAIMAKINPSNTIAIKIVGPFWSIFLWFLAPLLIGLSYTVLLCARSIKSYLALKTIQTVLLFIFFFIAASVFHRDFHSLFFPHIFLLATSALLKLPEIKTPRSNIRSYRLIITLAIVVIVLFSLWIMLMAWAIVTRKEPRWLESTVYNAINGLILVNIIYAVISLYHYTYSTLSLLQDDIILWNERDISSLFTDIERKIFSCYMHNNLQSNCSRLVKKIEDGSCSECKNCHEEGWSAIDCAFFRKAKKYTASIKRSLELLGAATILPADPNYRNIKIQGWRIHFFDNVTFNVHKKGDRSPLDAKLPLQGYE